MILLEIIEIAILALIWYKLMELVDEVKKQY